MVAQSELLGGVAVATGILGAFFLYKVYRYVHEHRNLFKEIGLNELPQKGWLGGFKLYADREDLFELERELVEKNGKVFGFFEGRLPVIMMADLDMAKQVMVKDHLNFMDRRIFFPSHENAMEITLDNLTGPRWKHVRQQLTPTFTPANLKRMQPLVNKVANQLVVNIGKEADEKKPFDVKEYCGFFSMDAIASVAFAIDIDSFNNQDNPFVVNVKKTFADLAPNGMFFGMLVLFPDYCIRVLKLTPFWKMFVNAFKFFENVITKEMHRRRTTEQSVERHDLLSQLMPLERDPKDPANKPYIQYDEFKGLWLTNGLTRDEICAQGFLFYIAGYETTASALALTLLCLCENPGCQERLFNELHANFGDGTREITLETLNDVTYLEMCINETLRYYTPLFRTERFCVNETVINGLRIPRGVGILIPIHAIHHDPDNWPNPEKYDPERFSPENDESLPKDAFLPFGAGNRNCIGKRLAMLELKLALAKLVLELKFTLSPETKLPIEWDSSFFRKPRNKIMLMAERRK